MGGWADRGVLGNIVIITCRFARCSRGGELEQKEVDEIKGRELVDSFLVEISPI